MNAILNNSAAITPTMEVKSAIENARKEYMKKEKEMIVGKYTLPTTPGKDGYYRIYVCDKQSSKGRRQLASKSLEELADKIYHHERCINGTARKTFAEIFTLVQEERIKYIKDPDKLLSAENTISKHQFDYNRFFKDTLLEQIYIDEISKKDIEDVILLNLQRYNLNKKAFDGMLYIIRNIFKLAFYEYWISDNTFERVNLKKYSGMLVETMPSSERAYTEKELCKILNYIRNYQIQNPNYIPAYALELQILMGLRRGEIPPLMWNDIKNGYISINKEQITVKKSNKHGQYDRIVQHTKTFKNRLFPISQDISDFLKKLKHIHSVFCLDSIYLFPFNTSNGVISNSIVYDFYERVINSLNLKKKDIIMGPHSFRRNAITDVVNATNGNLTLASQLFGNSPLVAENNYYTGVDMDTALSVLNKRKLS
ncbi:Site-specific recombinase XerD [Butyrivibrio hungatei DSM 14810]|uniref:Site-specific recombinase XerD n=1 Tax=Butyrivibrio hungatei DSM 14810 TaxID=1121132 RepID=A0A1M7SRX6_9FIRM|nr:site-specific integrase [Butyrivibrio hungatei]SHN61275.1 Site-specific recombinase XerD [Butyrivibrio hungatei DSM 14810]